MPRKYAGPLRPGEKSAKVPRTYVKKLVRAAPKSMANLTKMIKSIQLKEQETNYKSISQAVNAMNHNSINEFSLWSAGPSVFPAQGTGDGDRIGDRIYPKGIRVRMALDVPYDRKNVKVKMYYLPYNTYQGDPVVKDQLFHNVVNNTRLDPIQFKRWKGIKYLGTFSPKDKDAAIFRTAPGDEGEPGAADKATNTATIYINRFISINRKVWFKNDSSLQPTNLKEKGSILLLPYASVNTASSDNVILSGQCSFTCYFKDI
jgi:hypothetical protein|uniref:Capsid protein n=1 Tax=Pygoscelis antarcticus TaxID=79643 RepID=A0A7G7LKG3_PYGAN|nr:capsid protein [Pygoscelis antarcticus]QNG40980.1 capsid protein [Pygoscelis antarcticus]QNG41020.1 capsid protein [Pygoscelis antarcticus]QNG41028.1 capsid protein [Pygoscelis antarcticus]